MGLPRWVATAAVCAGVVTLTGCGAPVAVPPGTCVPLIAVEPDTVAPGSTITVTSHGACRVTIPPEGLTITAAGVGNLDSAIHAAGAVDAEGALRVQLQLPEDFPLGEAWTGIDDWDYSSCPANASCASPFGYFTVVARTAPS
jgi:hypothetical protein